MEQPRQITEGDVPSSSAIQSRIRAEAAELEQPYGRAAKGRAEVRR